MFLLVVVVCVLCVCIIELLYIYYVFLKHLAIRVQRSREKFRGAPK